MEEVVLNQIQKDAITSIVKKYILDNQKELCKQIVQTYRLSEPELEVFSLLIKKAKLRKELHEIDNRITYYKEINNALSLNLNPYKSYEQCKKDYINHIVSCKVIGTSPNEMEKNIRKALEVEILKKDFDVETFITNYVTENSIKNI